MLQVSLYRYNPESDEAPHMEEFSVDTGGKDLMVLDVLGVKNLRCGRGAR